MKDVIPKFGKKPLMDRNGQQVGFAAHVKRGRKLVFYEKLRVNEIMLRILGPTMSFLPVRPKKRMN